MSANSLSRTVISFTVVMVLLLCNAPATGQASEDPSKIISSTRAIAPKPTGYGPYPIGNIDVQIPRHDTVDVAARFYYPSLSWTTNATPDRTKAPWPTIVFIAGGMDTFGYCNGITGEIASWGFVVLNVELGNSYGNGLRNPITMANETTDVLNSNMSFILNQTMDTNKFGISGHSWGGAASGVAVTVTNGDKRFKAAVPISSTPFTNPADYSKDIHVPLELMAGDQGDNNLNSLFLAGNPPVTSIVVHGATHGGVLSYAEWPVSFFKYWLSGETDYEHWVYADGIRKDANITFKSKLYNGWAKQSATDVIEDSNVTFTAGTVGRTFGTVNYSWDLNGDGTYEIGPSSTNKTFRVFPTNGAFDMYVRIKDRYETKDLQFHVNVTNIPPVPVLNIVNGTGQNITVIEDTVVHMNANGSSDTPSDVPTLMFKWDFGDGTSTDYSTNGDASVLYTTAGVYPIKLWVKDNDDAIVNTTGNVTVNNLPPTAQAGPDKITQEDVSVDFTGTGSDTPTDLAAGLGFVWEFGDGNMTDWASNGLATHTYVLAGIYTATLHVKDRDVTVTDDTLNVTVGNLAPYAAITSPLDGDVIQKDQEIVVQGYASDTPTDLPWLEYSWDLGDGTTVAWGPQLLVAHTYTKGGHYKVVFSVRDRDGNVTISSSNITVVNQPPTITILQPDKDLTVDEDQHFHLKAEVADTLSDLDNLTVHWTVDGKEYNGLETDIVLRKAGEYPILATVTDPEGATVNATRKITVRNLAPKAQGSVSPKTLVEGGFVNFSGSGTDTISDLSNLTYEWNFGDGSSNVSILNGTHSFASPGAYTIRFSVKDDDGAVDEVQFTVTVTKKTVPPDKKPVSRTISPWAIGAIAGVVIFVVLLVVFLLLRRKTPKPDISDKKGRKSKDG
jgi:PKD repeat protein/dienelactone hydrolase